MPSNQPSFPQGPRIYNLFPTLLGPIERWTERLPEIAQMGFDWIFVNPFHLPGQSGSLYAVKDYYRLHPELSGDSDLSDDGDDDERLRAFTKAASDAGIAVMMDLVVNHTAIDSDLVTEHPDWYVHDDDGSVHSPSATDLDNPEIVTVWEDLAQLDYSERPEREAMIDFFSEVIGHYTALGFRGFRCDAAYQLPGKVWQVLIERAREAAPETRFFAETLGAPPDDIEQLRPAGFDYLFNSVKWWDFRGDWLLDQYQRFRDLAPSIAFPESHDTTRLAEESDGDSRESRFWYLFAAVFSTGVMMPIGYELGFRRGLHVVETRPQHWEEPSFYIRDFIAQANAMKAKTPVLNEEGAQERFTAADEPVVGLLRRSPRQAQHSAVLINPDPDEAQEYSRDRLLDVLDCTADQLQEITPASNDGANGKAGKPDSEKTGEGTANDSPTSAIHLPPRSLRIFIANH
ncbi:alpha-amylase family glycosyl hydrolase [Halochromatium roseum]|uniref:alpha-amylase family glycosyl hydrolase n=1 Tax=Halochromatium roseum TaxID=391920 RepID=UPI0019137710|nr:alpha-amylase family glycosyl hydrolase [Halochromatium roseum]MBK5938313.1 alpha-amylase [Halochromatium roseum]